MSEIDRDQYLGLQYETKVFTSNVWSAITTRYFQSNYEGFYIEKIREENNENYTKYPHREAPELSMRDLLLTARYFAENWYYGGPNAIKDPENHKKFTEIAQMIEEKLTT